MAESVPGLEDLSGSNPTHCPLCHASVDGKDGLQLHYLTSCASYSRLSSEQPRSKPRTNPASGPTPTAAPRTTGETFTPPTSRVQFLWQPLTEITYPEILLLASFEPGSVPLKLESGGSHYVSEYVSVPTGTYEGQLVIGDSFIYPVKKFSIIKPNSFIVLSFDVEQQRQFGSDTGIVSSSLYGSGMMQQNPSYSSPANTSTPSTTSSFFNSGLSDTYSQQTSTTPQTSSYPSVTWQHTTISQDFPAGSNYSQLINTAFYSSSTASKNVLTTSSSKMPRTAVSSHTRPTIAANFSSATVSSYGSSPATQSSVTTKPKTTPIVTTSKRSPPSVPTVTASGQEQGHSTFSVKDVHPPSGEVSMAQLVGILTKERDDLLANQTRLNAQWESQVKRLENELQASKSGKSLSQQQANAMTGQLREAQEQMRELEQELATLRRQREGAPTSSSHVERELSEMKDRNAALEQQLEEYAGTITDQSKYIQSVSVKEQVAGAVSNKELVLLSQHAKKQQLEYSEALANVQGNIQANGATYEEMNARLRTDMENYRQQLERLVTENVVKESELNQLRQALSSKSQDALDLELATMKQKVEAYQAEFAQVATVKDEAQRLTQQVAEQNVEIARLRADNEDLARQMQAVFDNPSGQDPSLVQKANDYDNVLAELHELRQKRIELENELQPLRQERAAMLTENASLREGSDPQNYTKLKQEHQALQEQYLETHALLTAQESSSREMQTRLEKNTNPEMLQSIKSRMDRYKEERDTARKKLDEQMQQSSLLQAEYTNIIKELEETLEKSERFSDEYKVRLEAQDAEIKQLRHAEERAARYRDERNVEKRKCRDLEKHVGYWKALVLKVNGDLPDYSSPNPLSDVPGPGSPVSEYQPYSTDMYQREAETSPQHEIEAGMATLSLEPSKTTRKRASSGNRQRVVSETSSFEMIDVKTKEGMRVANIGKPRGGFNVKKKPVVIVKRGEEYEQGTLVYLGELDGKEMAGVVLDCKITKPSSSGSHHDGTYKDGRKYFSANPGFGLFIPVAKVFIELSSAYV